MLFDALVVAQRQRSPHLVFELTNVARIIALRKQLQDKIAKLLRELAETEQQLTALKDKLAAGKAEDLFQAVKTIEGGVKVLATRAPVSDPKSLRQFADKVRDQLKSGILLLAGVDANSVALICMVTPDLTYRYKAGELIGVAAEVVGGRGGGKPETAQAGGKDPSKVDVALAKFLEALGAR